MRTHRMGSIGRQALVFALVVGPTLGCTASDPSSVAGGEIPVPEVQTTVGETQAVVGELPQIEPPADQLVVAGTEAWDEQGFSFGLRTGDLDTMIESRVIRALVVPSRTNWFFDGPVQRGGAYDAMKLFEEWVNEQQGFGTVKLHVVLIPTTREVIFRQLVDGYGDIGIGDLTITAARLESVDFTDPLISNTREVLVTGPSAPDLSSLDDLAGREIYVRGSSSTRDSLVDLNEQFRAAGLPAMTLLPAEEYLQDEDLLQMVSAGVLPFVVGDESQSDFWAQIYDGLTVRRDLVFRSGGDIAWAVRKDNPQLAALLNRFIVEHKQGTLMGNILLTRYLRDASRMRNILSGESRQAYDETVGLFATYAPQYGFDHMMMLAQGYQESRLDQNVRSNRGAVGIMQLLPTTAADGAVGIPDIEQADRNVEAGVKYMRWIRDTFFDDDAVDDVNKTLFSFASYNAGPNRIARLRSEAAERQLDPNEWFGNVELVVAEKIGRETVDYVSNIYKYYAAFSMLDQRERARSER